MIIDYDFGKNFLCRFDPPPIVRRRPRSPSRLHPSGLRNPVDSGAKSLLSRAAYRRMQAQASLIERTLTEIKDGSCALVLTTRFPQ